MLIAGVDLDGKITTRVCVKEFSTESVETTDMTFDFRTQIDGTSVTIDVLPGDKEQYYYSYYLEKSEVTQQGVNPAAEVQRSLSEIVELYYTYGLPADQAVMALCQKGDFQLTGTELEPNTVYLVVGIAVNNEGYVMSDLVQAEFTTGSPAPVDPSDNRITIEAANLTPTTVDLRITTTNKDPYLVYIFLQSEVANLSEEAIIEKTLQKKKYAHLREGDTTVKYYNREPNTSYVCVAMGYQSQQVTTKLFRCDFTTPSAGSAAAAGPNAPSPEHRNSQSCCGSGRPCCRRRNSQGRILKTPPHVEISAERRTVPSADIFCPRSPPSCMSFIAFYSFIREILLYLHYTNP